LAKDLDETRLKAVRLLRFHGLHLLQVIKNFSVLQGHCRYLFILSNSEITHHELDTFLWRKLQGNLETLPRARGFMKWKSGLRQMKKIVVRAGTNEVLEVKP
jgi:hypothetical protein